LWLFMERPPNSGLAMHGSRCFVPVVGMRRKPFVVGSASDDLHVERVERFEL
jgi:hypothetical protein